MITQDNDDLECDESYRQELFKEVMQECRHNAPGARFTARLRHNIERLKPSTRKMIVQCTADGCPPLWVAARRGATELVEYLTHVCGAPLEQTGALRGAGGEHRAPALWAAAIGGHEDTVSALLAAGAEVDARSDTGSTALRSACFMSHAGVAKVLLKHGADPCSANYSGGTCLINAVQSAQLTELLLKHGADPKAADVQLKTPLHYAAQEHRADTARLLLKYGADPTAKTRAGDDTLKVAAVEGAANVLREIAACSRHSTTAVADAYELLGTYFLHELNESRAALTAWRRGTALRLAHTPPLKKIMPQYSLPPTLRRVKEWRTPAELQALAGDSDAMYAHALLVALRVLGPLHNSFIFRIMCRGAQLSDSRHFRKGLEMWNWALDLRIQKDTLLHSDTIACACAGTRIVAEARALKENLPMHLMLDLYSTIARTLPECALLVKPRPVCRSQASAVDRAMRCLAHLILLIMHADTQQSEWHMTQLVEVTKALVKSDTRSPLTGDSLLHMLVGTMTTLHSDLPHLYPEGDDDILGAGPRGIRLLLGCGADVNARNLSRCTPLHVCALSAAAARHASAALRAAGAHLDTPTKYHDTPLMLLSRVGMCGPDEKLQLTLGCLAAATIVRYDVPVPPQTLPHHLIDFLELHRP